MKRIIFQSNIYLLVLSMGWACGGPDQSKQENAAVPVNLIEVNKQVSSYYDYYPSNIVALNEVQVRSELNGYITGIFFREGQQVKKGQKLYEIERSRYEASFSQAQANLAIAEANFDRANKDLERYEILDEKEAIAKQRLDYAKIENKNAKQQINSAKADLSKASIDLKHSILYAPFDGTIGISPVKMGTYVTAGQTILNTISSDNPMAVDFVINEKEIPRFMKLKEQPSKGADSLYSIILPDRSVYPYIGEIEFFDRAVDPLTGTLKIRLKFPNPDRLLKAGMSTQLRVYNNTGKEAIQIPYKAVTEQMGEFFVYTVKNDTARQQKVSLGPNIGQNVVIYTGLEPGDKIVIDGIQKLRDGVPVQIGIPAENKKDKAAKNK